MSKNKGSTAERELLHKFHGVGWGVMRAAGSGSTSVPCVDLLTSNSKRTLAIECKSSSFEKFYIDLEDIEQLREFSQKFGAEPVLGVRFNRSEWFFFSPEILTKTRTKIMMSLDFAKENGKLFDDLIKIQ